jgi:hypothetical protein
MSLRITGNGAPMCAPLSHDRALMGVTSALPAHDAALDEHHHAAAFIFVVAQAISAGHCQRLTFFERLAVSCSHIVHHVAHAPLLLGDSRAADTEDYQDSNNQGVHMSSLQWLQVYDTFTFQQFLIVQLTPVRAMGLASGCSGPPFISHLFAEWPEPRTNLF